MKQKSPWAAGGGGWGSPSGQLRRAAGCPRSAGRLKSRLALGRLLGQVLYSVSFSGSKIMEKQKDTKTHTVYNKASWSL